MGKRLMKTIRTKIRMILGVIAVIGLVLYVLLGTVFKADIVLPPGESQVVNLTNNGDAYEGSAVDNPLIPKYEKLELTFDIKWYKGRQFDRTPAKYDPLADEWSPDATYYMPSSVS